MAEPITLSIDRPIGQSPPPAPKVKLMTSRQARAAAAECGLKLIPSKMFAGLGQFGRYMDEIGGIRLGFGLYALSLEQIQKAIQQCDAIDSQLVHTMTTRDEKDGADGPTPTDIKLRILELRKELATKLMEIGSAMVKASPSRGPSPGQGVGATNILFAPKVEIRPQNAPPTSTPLEKQSTTT